VTTIAYRDGILAADTLETGDHTALAHTNKIHRLKNGKLFAAAGTADNSEQLLLALQNRRKPPELAEVEGLLVELDGSTWLYEGAVWFPFKAEYLSMGSGAKFALGAMDAGCSAEEAVKIACKRDLSTREPVQVMELNPKRGKRKK
jgi:ATP-dependent protease HslVU (ClpYQ) peptidase subunit